MRAIRASYETAQVQRRRIRARETADRRPARAVETGQHGPLRADFGNCGGIADGRQQPPHLTIVLSARDADRPLSHRRQHLVRIEHGAGLVQAEPQQTGARQQRRRHFAGRQLAQARMYVAAKRNHLKVGPARQHLRLASWRRRADDGLMRQVGDMGDGRDQHVPRILARQDGPEGQAGGKPGRQVFHRVDSKVDRAGQHRLVDLLAEQPLAPDIGERAVQYLVASRADHHRFQARRIDQPR
jgi:hypothetical protein